MSATANMDLLTAIRQFDQGNKAVFGISNDDQNWEVHGDQFEMGLAISFGRRRFVVHHCLTDAANKVYLQTDNWERTEIKKTVKTYTSDDIVDTIKEAVERVEELRSLCTIIEKGLPEAQQLHITNQTTGVLNLSIFDPLSDPVKTTGLLAIGYEDNYPTALFIGGNPPPFRGLERKILLSEIVKHGEEAFSSEILAKKLNPHTPEEVSQFYFQGSGLQPRVMIVDLEHPVINKKLGVSLLSEGIVLCLRLNMEGLPDRLENFCGAYENDGVVHFMDVMPEANIYHDPAKIPIEDFRRVLKARQDHYLQK